MKHPYAKAAGLALFIHVAALGLAVFVAGRIGKPQPAPIVIDIEPPRLLSMGSGLHPAGGGAAAAGPKSAAKPGAAAIKKPPAPAPPAPKAKAKPKIVHGRRAPKRPARHRPERPKPAEARLYAAKSLPPPLPSESPRTSIALPAQAAGDTEGKTPSPDPDGPSGAGERAGGDKNARSGTGGEAGAGGGGAYTGAGYLSGALPVYPPAERSSGREGVAIVRVLVGADGVPVSVAVRATSGCKDFDSAALKAVKKWRFSPAKKGGTPVAGFFDVRVRFRMDEGG